MKEGINFLNKHSFKVDGVARTIISVRELQLYVLHCIPKVSTPGIYILVRKSREKEMATYSRALAWRISGTAEPGGLPSMGSHRARHD